ncbi:MAG: hypothetical protein WCI74_03925 [Actinomycetes bacterium]
MQPARRSLLLRIVLWVLVAAVVISVLAVSATAVLFPGCATLCHGTGAFAADTKAGTHGHIACVGCHVDGGVGSRVQYAVHELVSWAPGAASTLGAVSSSVSNARCLSCHKGIMRDVVVAKGLRIDHQQCSKDRTCVSCHSTVAHGASTAWPRVVQMDTCLECHSASAVRSACDKCHVTRTQDERLNSGPWAVTHGPKWRQTHGMGDLRTCRACHPDDYCSRCHGISLPHPDGFVDGHPAVALENPESCRSCHQPAFCVGCHGLEMPHPVEFTPAHPGIVTAGGKAICTKCHAASDCTNCHQQHVHPGGATLPPAAPL